LGGFTPCSLGHVELTLHSFYDFPQVAHDPDLFRAGGFIPTADEIVQHFSLPRSQYYRPKDRAPSLPASDDDVEMVPDSDGVIDRELRNSTRVIDNGGRHEDEDIEVHSETEATKGPMKTMAELAAEHAEREHQLGQGSTGGSKLSRRTDRPSRSRARKKLTSDEIKDEPDVDENEDHLGPSLTDGPYDPSPPRRYRTASLKAPSRTDTRSSSKSTSNPRKKRPRSSDPDQGSDAEYGGSSRSKATSTGRRPRRTTTARTGGREPGGTLPAQGSSAASVIVPVSDRVLRSRKVRV
jgi:hypothetical protein